MQATTTVLVAFMAGLALGSAAAERFLDRTGLAPLEAYALLEATVAATSALPLLPRGAGALLPSGLPGRPPRPPRLTAARFLGSFLFLLLPTAAMGATLPALDRHDAAPLRRTGRAALVDCFVSGFAALGLEVVALRVLLLVFGSTTYAFTITPPSPSSRRKGR